MSDLKFACPHCNQHLELPEEMCGTVVDCPACNNQIQTPPRAQVQEERSASTYTIIGGDDKQYGPITADQLRQWISEGRVDMATSVHVEGHADWTPLGELPEFAVPPSRHQPLSLQPPPRPSPTRATATVPHQLTTFPVAVVILLHFVTFGIFTFIWLNLMHGKMCRVRVDDPSAGRAIGFCFIPFFNLYWIFFTYRRLCLRIDEQRDLYGLPPSNLRGLATTACIFQVIPYLNILIDYTIITPIFLGMIQSSVNQLARTSVTTAPRTTLPASTEPARGMSGCLIAAIICACLIPVLGLLSAIAIPAFVNARALSQRNACLANMKQLEVCKEQIELSGKPITKEEVSSYLKNGFSGLICPKGGQYSINPPTIEPACSEHGSLSEAMRRR